MTTTTLSENASAQQPRWFGATVAGSAVDNNKVDIERLDILNKR